MRCSRAMDINGGTADAHHSIEPEKILKDLRNLWSDLGRNAEVSGGVLRACGMTLVVAAESAADCQELRHTLGVLMHDHPARAIVLRLNEKPGLDASVFSQCWMPFGKHQQICAEGIEITRGISRAGSRRAVAAAADRLRSAGGAVVPRDSRVF